MSPSFPAAPGQTLVVPSISHPPALCHPGEGTFLPGGMAAWGPQLLRGPDLPFGQRSVTCLRFWGRAGCGAFLLPHLPQRMPSPVGLLGSLGQKPPCQEGHEPLALKYTAGWWQWGDKGMSPATCVELCRASASSSAPSPTLVPGGCRVLRRGVGVRVLCHGVGVRVGAGAPPYKSCCMAASPPNQLPSGVCPAGRRAVKGIQPPATHLCSETLQKVPERAAGGGLTCWEAGNEKHPTPCNPFPS